METVQLTERDLLIQYRDARKKEEAIEASLKTAKAETDKAEALLIELLTARNATATAKYDGVGCASLVKPRLFASCKKENEDLLFEYLEKEGRSDLIKQSVHAGSLSGFVKEKVELGQAPPDFINYYLKPSIRLTE